MDNYLLETRDIFHSYGNFHAVNGISLGIRQGEIFGLLGPNGAGKTTTISIMVTLLRPTRGKVFFNGDDVYDNLMEVRRHIGLVPQELSLYEKLSGRDNLRFFGKMYGLVGKILEDQIDEVLKIVGLLDWGGRPVANYSGGMKRRLNMAVGLIHKPRIIFMDEPTVGVDPQSRNHIFDCIKQVCSQGTAIVYTTHYMEEAEMLCHRIAIIDGGKVIALDTLKNLLALHGLQAVELELDKPLETGHLEILRGLDHLESITPMERSVMVKAKQLTKVFAEIINFLSGSYEIRSFRTPENNLENIFLSLTGRKLRD